MEDPRKAYTIAQDLYNAINRRDTVTISEITGRYVSGYREKIALAFVEQYNALPSDLFKRWGTGYFESLMIRCWTNRHESRAKMLKEAIRGALDRDALVDLVILCSTDDWNSTLTHYQKHFKIALKADLRLNMPTDRPWKALIDRWVEHDRHYRNNTKTDAHMLFQALEGSDGATIVNLLATTKPQEWEKIVITYEENANMSLETAICMAFPGFEQTAFCAAHYWLCEPSKAAAFLIHRACEGRRGDFRRVCRITSLVLDQCLKCKYVYSVYGHLAADLRKAFSDNTAIPLISLWRAYDIDKILAEKRENSPQL